MVKTKEQLVLRKADYDLLISYLRGGRNSAAFDRRNAEEMEEELKKAKLVPAELFPEDVVGLNSRVTIKDEDRNAVMQYELVIPERADIKAKRISIMAPLGTALLASPPPSPACGGRHLPVPGRIFGRTHMKRAIVALGVLAQHQPAMTLPILRVLLLQICCPPQTPHPLVQNQGTELYQHLLWHVQALGQELGLVLELQVLP